MFADFFSDNAISSKPSIKHFFLNVSKSNLTTLLPNIISWGSSLISIFSCLFEYSDNFCIFFSSSTIGRIPFLKQLL